MFTVSSPAQTHRKQTNRQHAVVCYGNRTTATASRKLQPSTIIAPVLISSCLYCVCVCGLPVVSSCRPTSKASLSVEDREVDRQHRYWIGNDKITNVFKEANIQSLKSFDHTHTSQPQFVLFCWIVLFMLHCLKHEFLILNALTIPL